MFFGEIYWKDQLARICDVMDTHHTLCMLLGWQRISSRFYESFFFCEKSRKRSKEGRV
jgi:hypothetical protein